MTIPKSSVWQELRASCLDAIPRESRIDWTRPASLSAWQATGFYSVPAMTSKSFRVVVSAPDFGAALLTDAEFFLDHAAEHQATLWQIIQGNDWSSPGWSLVTLYYWGFFLTLALTRLLGVSAWFMPRDVVLSFRDLAAPSLAKPPGAGSFRIECGQMLSATDREVLLLKAGGRVHEELWSIYWNICREKRLAVAASTLDPLEDRLYTVIARAGMALGSDWPSALRNAINYRPGFAYSAVRGNRALYGFRRLANPRSYTGEELIGKLEDALSSLQGARSIFDAPHEGATLLVAYVLVLHALATEMHGELLERHGFDTRWREARLRFLREHGVSTAADNWPY